MDLLSLAVFCLSFMPLSMSQLTERDEYGTCQYIYTRDYGYNMSLHIPKAAILPDKSIHLNFSVQTSSNVHVLFSTIFNPNNNDSVYEIVIGADRNTRSDIRRRRMYGYPIKSMPTKGIVNETVINHFWIKIADGLVSVGKRGSSSFLEYKFIDPLDVKYVSFGSWYNISAIWYFDCEDHPALPPAVLNTTASEKLRHVLFNHYDPYIVPLCGDDDFFILHTNLTINHIFLDTNSSSMDVRGMLHVRWDNLNFQWTPSDYEGIDIIPQAERNIWHPNFLLSNGATMDQKWFDDGNITLNYQGEVNWITPVHIVTRCNITMDEWPEDQHTCQIQIELVDNRKLVHLTGVNDIILENVNNGGIWEVISVDGGEMKNISQYEVNLEEISTSLTVTILMKRCSSSYNYLFYIPLKVTMVISVISFCFPFTCPQRVVLQVVVLIMYVINFLSIDSVLPPGINVTPKILSLCAWLLMIAVTCPFLTLTLLILWHARKRVSLSTNVGKLVDRSSFKLNLSSYNKKGQKLDDKDEEDETIIKLKVENKSSDKQRFQTFLLILDYLLLTSIIIFYTILILLF